MILSKSSGLSQTFQFYGSIVSDEITWGNTWIEFTFDQTVTVTRSFNPEISLTKFFADLGGSLGLWLGVGMLQMTAAFHEAFSGMLFKRK